MCSVSLSILIFLRQLHLTNVSDVCLHLRLPDYEVYATVGTNTLLIKSLRLDYLWMKDITDRHNYTLCEEIHTYTHLYEFIHTYLRECVHVYWDYQLEKEGIPDDVSRIHALPYPRKPQWDILKNISY